GERRTVVGDGQPEYRHGAASLEARDSEAFVVRRYSANRGSESVRSAHILPLHRRHACSVSADVDICDARRRQSRSQAPVGDRAIARLAERQHGVVTRRQLVALGLSERAVDRRVAAGRLHRVHRSVYAVGHAGLTRDGRWNAAALAGGKRAALSHHATGALLGLISYSGWAHVTAPKPRRPPRGIVWHSSEPPVGEIDRAESIPITTAARPLLALASCLDRHRLERAIDRAEGLGLASPTSLSVLIDRYRGRRGVGTLREILDEGEIARRMTKSDLEDLFLAFIARFGLPRPETNVWMEVGGRMIEADCVWREARLIVELDSRTWHHTT